MKIQSKKKINKLINYYNYKLKMKNYKANIKINLKKGILDVQGKTIENALHSLDFIMFSDVQIGKYVIINVEAQNDGQAKVYVEDACKKLITNPIIEDYEIEIIELD